MKTESANENRTITEAKIRGEINEICMDLDGVHGILDMLHADFGEPSLVSGDRLSALLVAIRTIDTIEKRLDRLEGNIMPSGARTLHRQRRIHHERSKHDNRCLL